MARREPGQGHALRNIGVATAAVAGVTILTRVARRAGRAAPRARGMRGAQQVTRTTTINRPAGELYRFWRDVSQLPRFMAHLEKVDVIDDRRSRWTVRGPLRMRFEWDAEITEDRPDELIAWRSLQGADVHHTGRVRFVPAPGGKGTEVHVEMRYEPPGGSLGASVARLFGREPGQQVDGDLRRFKQVMETGEVVHSDPSIHRGPHPGRPSAGSDGRSAAGERPGAGGATR